MFQPFLSIQRNSAQFENNMIPMINVVFLLLVFFMIAGTIRQIHSQDVELPISNNNKALSPSSIDIVITKDQILRLNGETISLEGLTQALPKLMSENSKNSVTLRADKKLQAQELDLILNSLRQQGVLLISLYSLSERNPS